MATDFAQVATRLQGLNAANAMMHAGEADHLAAELEERRRQLLRESLPPHPPMFEGVEVVLVFPDGHIEQRPFTKDTALTVLRTAAAS